MPQQLWLKAPDNHKIKPLRLVNIPVGRNDWIQWIIKKNLKKKEAMMVRRKATWKR